MVKVKATKVVADMLPVLRYVPCNADMASVRRAIHDWGNRAKIGRQSRSIEADTRKRDRAAQAVMDRAREERAMLRTLI